MASERPLLLKGQNFQNLTIQCPYVNSLSRSHNIREDGDITFTVAYILTIMRRINAYVRAHVLVCVCVYSLFVLVYILCLSLYTDSCLSPSVFLSCLFLCMFECMCPCLQRVVGYVCACIYYFLYVLTRLLEFMLFSVVAISS